MLRTHLRGATMRHRNIAMLPFSKLSGVSLAFAATMLARSSGQGLSASYSLELSDGSNFHSSVGSGPGYGNPVALPTAASMSFSIPDATASASGTSYFNSLQVDAAVTVGTPFGDSLAEATAAAADTLTVESSVLAVGTPVTVNFSVVAATNMALTGAEANETFYLDADTGSGPQSVLSYGRSVAGSFTDTISAQLAFTVGESFQLTTTAQLLAFAFGPETGSASGVFHYSIVSLTPDVTLVADSGADFSEIPEPASSALVVSGAVGAMTLCFRKRPKGRCPVST